MGLGKILAELARKSLIRLAGGQTVGVRAIVVNQASELVLVRHTYRPGWHLPGGAVDRGESAEDAVVREVREEAGVLVEGRPRLFAAYLSRHQGVDDFPLLYVIDRFRTERLRASAEIAEMRWFAMDSLPPETTRATCRRIAEYRGSVQPQVHWTPEAEDALDE